MNNLVNTLPDEKCMPIPGAKILELLTGEGVILKMNYLAHAFLSFNRGELLTGNMISDFVKGSAQYAYPPGIRAGILLHRAIDIFTDAHPATARAKSFFRPAYRLYAGALSDVVYDHFLARDDARFEAYGDLGRFSRQTYSLLERYEETFPARFRRLFPYMKTQDWLSNYRSGEGLRQSFEGLRRRSKYITETDTAFRVFEEEYASLQECYTEFFPEVLRFSRQKIDEICGERAG